MNDSKKLRTRLPPTDSPTREEIEQHRREQDLKAERLQARDRPTLQGLKDIELIKAKRNLQ